MCVCSCVRAFCLKFIVVSLNTDVFLMFTFYVQKTTNKNVIISPYFYDMFRPI